MNTTVEKCPVCFYIKNPDLLKNSSCMKCSNKNSLWFCITCGHIGCGRGVQRHALEHYEKTQHNYVMGVQKFKIWDYKLKQYLRHMSADNQNLENVSNQVDIENSSSSHNNITPTLLKRPTCMSCEENLQHNLWKCLTCNYIGCSRTRNKHARQHYMRTNHKRAMQLNNYSIWDYQAHKYLPREERDTEAPTEATNAKAPERAE